MQLSAKVLKLILLIQKPRKKKNEFDFIFYFILAK